MNVKDHGLSIRLEAIAILKTEIEQKIVASRLGVGLRSIQRWWHNDKHGKDQNTKPRPGRISTMKKVCKIVISESLGKRGKSTRKLARYLNGKGYSISHFKCISLFDQFFGSKTIQNAC